MTGQIIAFGVFVAILAGLLIHFLWETLADDEFEDVEEFDRFQRDAWPQARR